MILSRKWLNEFVDVSDISDREFDEAMTLSGSKVESVADLSQELKNVVAGRILRMDRHPDSDHMVICKVDVDAEPALAARFGVMSIPTVMVFVNGQPVAKQIGAAPKTTYAAMLDQAL